METPESAGPRCALPDVEPCSNIFGRRRVEVDQPDVARGHGALCNLKAADFSQPGFLGAPAFTNAELLQLLCPDFRAPVSSHLHSSEGASHEVRTAARPAWISRWNIRDTQDPIRKSDLHRRTGNSVQWRVDG